MTRNRVAILHGVNLDALDRRPAGHYGDLTFAQLETRVARMARDAGLEPHFFQTNHEGAYVEKLHKATEYADALLLNPGAWTHYSWAIRDALEIAALPAVEVHLSDVRSREKWRRVSVLDGLCLGTVSGSGLDGYGDALEILRESLEAA